MLQELKTILNRNEDIEEDVLKNAGYALLSQQFLHRKHPRSRKYYELISRFHNYFKNLADAMGYELVVDETYGYAGVVPQYYVSRMKLDEALLLLVMRQIYDEEIIAFHANEDGSVLVAVDDLELRYKQLTNRDLAKTKGEFDQLTDGLRRKGIINIDADPDNSQQLVVSILPSITAVVNNKSIDNIRVYLRAEDVAIDHPDDSEDL